jgi:hypothetical protein
MKKINFETTLKVIVIISFAYFLFLLTIIAYNSGIGRYQFKADRPVIIDTKTGHLYRIKDGQMTEIGK